IRAGGILQPSSVEEEAIDIEAVGFTEYPKQVPFRGTWGAWDLGNPVGIGIDPLDAVRYLWNYIQRDERRDLGVTLDTTKSKVKRGRSEERRVGKECR